MYESLLLVHSWMRWILLAAMIYFLCKSYWGWKTNRAWAGGDNHFVWAFNQLFGFQVLFGLTIWLGLSPFSKAGFKDPRLILENAVVLFWTVRHPLTMILAFGVFHMGKAKGRRAQPTDRFKIYALTFTSSLLLIFSAIPWPGLIYGRQFFRWFL